jgi:uncharacterized membrane protein YkoI
MDKKIIIGVIVIIAVVAIGIGIFAFNGETNENNSSEEKEAKDNVEEYPDSPEYIGKEKAIEIFNNKDPSGKIQLSISAGSVMPTAEDLRNFKATDAKLIKNEDGIMVYQFTLTNERGTYSAFVDAKTGEIL